MARRRYIDRTALKKDADSEAMLESECTVLKSVNHPNIVRLYEIYNTEDTLILVMEYGERAGGRSHPCEIRCLPLDCHCNSGVNIQY